MGTVKCSEIIKFMEGLAPVSLAEDWDNVGLIIGSPGQEVKKVLVCLDVTSRVAEEAVEKKVSLIISHHPFIFKGIKRINENEPKGGIIYKLIRNGTGVYSAHTNLDFAVGGINDTLAGILGLSNIKNLKKYKSGKLYKVVVFVPEKDADTVRDAMSGAGAGWLGNYSDCSFMAKGKGTFRPLDGANPYIGSKGNLERVDEYRLETIVPEGRLKGVLSSMLEAHPYEEVAYDVYPLELSFNEYGMGKTGVLDEACKLEDFILLVKERLNIENVRVIGRAKSEIRNVAVFCGGFDESIFPALKEVDALVTGDLKYHASLDASEEGLLIIDAGHFATERIMVPRLVQLLSEKFAGINIEASTVEEDPIKIT